MSHDFDPSTIIYAFDKDGLGALRDLIYGAEDVVFDLETSGLHPYKAGEVIVMASFTLPQRDWEPTLDPPSVIVPLWHPDSPYVAQWVTVAKLLAKWMDEAGTPVIGHNLKFDLKWMHAHTGFDLSHLHGWDTKMSSQLLDENTSTALKPRAAATYGIERWDDHDFSRIKAHEVPIFDLAIYAARDTFFTYKLAKDHRAMMGLGEMGSQDHDPYDDEDRELLGFGVLTDRLIVPVAGALTAVEQRGFALDNEWVDKRTERANYIMAETRSALIDIDRELSDSVDADSISFEPTSNYFRDFMARSVERGEIAVTKVTAKGKPSWDKSVLRQLAASGNDTATILLAYREASKEIGFLRSWLELQAPDKRIHATYNLATTVTGRLSCSDPNMQQISKDVKPAYSASREDWVVVEADFSQIELRIAAELGNVETIKGVYTNGDMGGDVHRLLPARILGVEPSEVDKDQRQRGKAGSFGFLFGMSPEKFEVYARDNYQVQFTPEEAIEYRRAFYELWDGLAEWQNGLIESAKRHGKIINRVGRVRRLPSIIEGDPHAHNQAVNFPVQSLAAEIMMLALTDVYHHEDDLDVRLLGTVHDSMIFECPFDGYKNRVVEVCKRMTDVNRLLAPFNVELHVPFEVEAVVSDRWGGEPLGVIEV